MAEHRFLKLLNPTMGCMPPKSHGWLMRLGAVLIFTLTGSLFAGSPARAAVDVKEINIISDILKRNAADCKRILKDAYRMREQALPFTDPHHQAKYRFKPSDGAVRNILNLTRLMRSRFKLLSGVLYHAATKDRTRIFNAVNTSLDNVVTSAKRALRAIKDGNFALYLASSQTADREARIINNSIADLENLINQSILDSDEKQENL